MGKKRKRTSLTEDGSNIKRVSEVIYFMLMILFSTYICLILLMHTSGMPVMTRSPAKASGGRPYCPI